MCYNISTGWDIISSKGTGREPEGAPRVGTRFLFSLSAVITHRNRISGRRLSVKTVFMEEYQRGRQELRKTGALRMKIRTI
ncbi:hypothetical protein NPIL_268631 [Nephila pilipes]|uniref:Uncharacterized protein n=1 Tax=Nephila pilipes TaxID=299642 RepID=A0A8X6NJZ7_NEPPI|nr:hypothetical protein NPIL_268631 [Nephila pilipes]